MDSLRRWVGLVCAGMLLCLAAAAPVWGGETVERPAFPGLGRLLLPEVGPGAVRADGDLSEWAGRPFVYMSDRWQRIQAESELPVREDRAAAALARDGEALFIAFRVVDEEVANTYPENLWQGDCVELFVDVRPEGEGLGQAPYAPGCYQLVFSPVSLEGEPEPRWRCPQMDAGAPDELQVASVLLDDGYGIETRIPFVELNGAGSERFASPVGIDFQVDDALVGPEGECTDRVAYSWRGWEGSYQSPGIFGRTVPVTTDTPSPEVVSYVPPRLLANTPERRIVSAVATLPGVEPPELALQFRYEATRGDRPLEEEDWEVPAGTEAPRAESDVSEWEDAVLGLHLRERTLELSRPIGGRYYFTAECALGDAPATDEARFYYYEGEPEGRLARVTDAPTAEELLARLTEGLYMDFQSPNWVFADQQMRLSVSAPPPECAWGLSERLGAEEPVAVELRLRPLDGEVEVDAHQQALTPRGAFVRFETDDLPDGVYVGRLYVVPSEGEARPVIYPDDELGPTYWPTEIVGIERGRDYELSAVINDSSEMLAKAVPVGDPYREQFPEDDEARCFARSIWDLQLYEGRIYTGCGDWNRNQGPVDILSFGPPEGEHEELTFQREFTIDGESVEAMRVLEGRLVVPDIDPRDPWELGNLYIKHEGEWVKRRTVPNGIHSFDVAYRDGRLHVATGTESGAALYASEDWGQTWETVARDEGGAWGEGRFYQLALAGDTLAVAGSRSREYMHLLSDGELRRIIRPFVPGAEACWYPYRLTTFGGGCLYAPRLFWTQEVLETAAPLYLVRDFQEGGWLVDGFQQRQVHDILARDGQVFVLSSRPAEDGYAGEVLRSDDARNWLRIAAFTTPARAESLERLNGTLYVGLASAYDEANPMSGRICRLE
ncbi:MAG: sugar-binding protein [Candidatus Brocadiia bacterium]